MPQEVLYESKDFKTPIPDRHHKIGVLLEHVFKIHNEETFKYELNSEASEVFWQHHDEQIIPNMRKYQNDDNRRGIISKSEGFIVRLAGIIHVMKETLKTVDGELLCIS